MAGERLRVISGDQSGEVIALDGELILGRAEKGAGSLGGDQELSRRHARVSRREDGQLVIEDLGSTNGTLVNGQRISAPTPLRPGDAITVGETKLETLPDPNATRIAPRAKQTTIAEAPPPPPPVEREQAAPPQVPAPSAPRRPSAPTEPLAPAAQPPFRPPGRERRPDDGGGRRRLVLLLSAVAVVGIIVAAVVLIVTSGGGGKKKSTPTGGGATVASDCGRNIGSGGERVASVAYVESNIAKSSNNSVIAIPYRAGDMKPLAMSQCSTGGKGSADLTDSGVLDADNQVIVNATHTLLFAVNQGSDSIAVFKVAPNGALTPSPGSPYSSGGKAPASLGLSGNTLVVANKAQDGVRDLTAIAPNYTSFHIGPDGRLSPIAGSTISADPGSSPTHAYIPPNTNRVVFGTEESGPLRGLAIADNGRLVEAANSPLDIDAAVFADGFDPKKEFALGVAANPSRPLVYISMPTVPSLAVYSYDPTGKLTFIRSVPNAGAYLPCWNVVTRDGRWLYTANADTNNVTVFDIGTDPTQPRQIQTLAFSTPGNPWNEALDPKDRFLFVNTPRDTLKVPEGEGNTQHVMSVGADGKLNELPTSPTKLPVPGGTNPQGIAVISGEGAS
jgi:FHA domain-containing protein/lactonase family protein with 7-bladed beta-propeller